MNEQLLLFKEPESEFPGDSLVLAVFPDHYTAERIVCLGKELRQAHRLVGEVRRVDHLHISLPLPGAIKRPSRKAVDIIGRVCQAVAATAQPFEITLDRMMRFGGKYGNHSLVLGSDGQGTGGITRLQEMLRVEFAKCRYTSPKVVPHLTLLYDQAEFSPGPVEPVGWTVKGMALVCSEVGETTYHPLGQWVFGG